MEKTKQKLLQKLTNKYRLVIMNDETFEENASFRMSRINVYLVFSTLVVILFLLIMLFIVYTPLKNYIPGYGDVNLRKDFLEQTYKIDSLERVNEARDMFIVNLKNILEGNIDTLQALQPVENVLYDSINTGKISEADSLLRLEYETYDNSAFAIDEPNESNSGAVDFHFLSPINGYITAHYDQSKDHYGIDVAGAKNEPIKAITSGMVIISSWTVETGYVIGIQHENNLVSFYKHNSVLLKKVGNFVNAGDAIAIIGNSGELSSGPHLHFELWHDGKPLNPEDYFIF